MHLHFQSPILEKELLVALRSRAVRWGAGVLCLALSVVAIFAVATVSHQATSRPLSVDGREAFGAFSLFLIPGAALFAMLLAAPAVAEERESRTLDVLLSTRLTPFAIVWGKFQAVMVSTALALAASLPAAAACFAMGGVRVHEAVATYLVAFAVAAACGSLGLLGSALARRTRGAMGLTGLLFLLFGLPVGMVLLFGTGAVYFEELFGGARVLWPSVAMVVGTLGVMVWTALSFVEVRLSPPGVDGTLPMRRAMMGTLGMSIGVMLLMLTVPVTRIGGMYGRNSSEAAWAGLILSVAALLVLFLVQGVFIASEPDRMDSRRGGVLRGGSFAMATRFLPLLFFPALLIAAELLNLAIGRFDARGEQLWKPFVYQSKEAWEYLAVFGLGAGLVTLYLAALSSAGAWLSMRILSRAKRAGILIIGTLFTLVYPALAMPFAELIGRDMNEVWTLSFINPVLGVTSAMLELESHPRDLEPGGLHLWVLFAVLYSLITSLSLFGVWRARRRKAEPEGAPAD